MKVSASLVIAAMLVAGCTTPMPQGGRAEDDRDTGVTIQDTPDGFTVAVTYSRYQFIPETSAVATACRSQLLAAAHDTAARKGRAIEQINEQRIRLSTGRNGLTGMTSCEASVPATWKK